MNAAITSSDPKEQRQFQNLRIDKQREMLMAALKVYELGVRLPASRAPVSPEEVPRLEGEWGLDPGRYETTFEELRGGTAVRLKQSLDLALKVTERERAAEPPDTGPEFVAAVVRICCTTVIGALVGAPLGALIVHADVISKIAGAGVVTGLSATAAEVIRPFSVKFAGGLDEPTKPDPLASFNLAQDAVRGMENLRPRPGALPRPDDLNRKFCDPRPPELPTRHEPEEPRRKRPTPPEPGPGR